MARFDYLELILYRSHEFAVSPSGADRQGRARGRHMVKPDRMFAGCRVLLYGTVTGKLVVLCIKPMD